MSTETKEKEMSPQALRVAAAELIKSARNEETNLSGQAREFCLHVADFLRNQAEALEELQKKAK